MGLKCGIVGLPNVGKATIFNALTKAGIAAENYPFCTIEPNVGVVEVPDPRLKALSEIVHPERVVPAAVEFVDIAGLVAGASKGEGLASATPSPTSSVASPTTTSFTSPARSIRLTTSTSSTPNSPSPTFRPSKRPSTATASRPAPAATRKPSSSCSCSRSSCPPSTKAVLPVP